MTRFFAAGIFTLLAVSTSIISATEIHLNGYGAGGVSSGTANRATGGDGVAVGNGWTPNISVAYDTLTPAFAHTNTGLGTWGGGYGNLDTVAFPNIPPESFGDFVGAWWFTPDLGYRVTINSFDMGGYSFTDRPDQPIFIRTESGQVLWDGSGTVLGANGAHSSFAPNVSSTERLYIIFGDNWNVGIDNINFDQAAIPEPSSLVLAGSLGVAAFFSWQRRKQRC